MNESILNGLLNLFAVFASIVKIEKGQAVQAVHSYLSSHFGVRSHKEYIALYNELRSMYDDSLYAINKENVVYNICKQMKLKLAAEEQLLLLVRFMEFACKNSDEFENHLSMFQSVSGVFQIPEDEFADTLAFILGRPSPAILSISGEADSPDIRREGMEGQIRVWLIRRFGRYLFTYEGEGMIFMNDIPVAAGIFYTWQHSSVVKGPHFLPVYFSDLQAVFNKDNQKDYVFLSGREVYFSFVNSSAGLHNFSFDLESGQLVAIMGGSGVGKSTLLGILNGNIQPDRGSVTLNGYPVDTPQARRLIGFVPQDDLLIEELTVFQNLWFTARFCFDGVPDSEIEKRVNQVLKDLSLSEIKDLEVGSPIRKIISGGQRKRLNIALELIREPAVLYLDEPTSGLSSSDSEKVMMLLKEQTHKGKLIVVNIHQPSSEIYKLFDRLWLLDKGGYPIYDGNPIEAITYFKHAAKYTDQGISVCSACGNVNPELILNIIDSKKIDDSGNQTDIRKFTSEEWHEMYLNVRPEFQAVEADKLPDSKQKKPSWLKQFLIFSERNIRRKLTNLQYLSIALLEAPLLAWIVALLTKFAPDGDYTLLGNKNLLSYLFMSVIVVTFIGLSISAEEIIKDRIVLKRERFLRLSRSSYLSAKMLYLFVLSGVQTLLFILVGNSIIEIGRELFFVWWTVLWATAFLANLTGLWLSQTLNSIVSIYITIPLLLIPQILLCGLVIPFEDLNSGAEDTNLTPLIGEVIPSRWAFEALMVEQFTANAYNQRFFTIEKEKFLAQYYKDVHLPEVRKLAETYAQGDSTLQPILANETLRLAQAARIQPPLPGESYPLYLEKADSALRLRAHNFTAYTEQTRQKLIKEQGSEWLIALKQRHHNEAIEALVTGQGKRFFKQIGDRLYPQIGQVYMPSDNPWGRAPFYSHEKRIGPYSFSTYLFNLIILYSFAILAIIAIFAEFPGKYFRGRNEY
ncbi:MAG: ATP-binding cassette domain-containing protein [Tannerellaceae bacterium]|jgi:ABC-type multidrug transport system ATPase subunit|nr:ATP-binding cassette domain-containing protein [Tannerellaceae bacterium]